MVLGLPGLGRGPPGFGLGLPGLGWGPPVWAGDPLVWARDRGPDTESALKIAPENIKLQAKRVHVKEGGKSSYQKLRKVMSFLFYGTDNSETSFKIHFPAKLAQIRKIKIFGPLRN